MWKGELVRIPPKTNALYNVPSIGFLIVYHTNLKTVILAKRLSGAKPGKLFYYN